MEYEIRKAYPDDAHDVIAMMIEFAELEGISADAVKLTTESFAKYGFGKNKCFSCDIGWLADLPISYALYSTRFSGISGKPVLYLEDLYVINRKRNQGYGKSLLTHVINVSKDGNCAFVEWLVADWNSSAQEFYRTMGAELKSDYLVSRLKNGQ